MIKYDKLWLTMKKKGITKYKLRKNHNIVKAQLDRLKHNESVTTNTLDLLCNILECKIEDIMEHFADDNVF